MVVGYTLRIQPDLHEETTDVPEGTAASAGFGISSSSGASMNAPHA